MRADPKCVRVCLVAIPEVMASTLMGLYDVLNSFNLLGTYGDGLAGTTGVPFLRAGNRPVVGSTLTLQFGNSRGNVPGGSGLLLAGGTRVAVPVLGGTLLVDPVLSVPLTVPASQGSFVLAVPNLPALVGVPADFQVAQSDAGAPFGVVCLSQGSEVRRLDPGRGGLELLRPCPDAWLEAVPVSTRVNSPRNDDETIIQPEGAPLAAQRTLF